MEIHESREGDVLVLAPDGTVAGLEEISVLETKLGEAVKSGFRQLVLDCAAVGHLSSAAIRVLLLTSRKVERTDGRLVLFAMNAKLAKAFSVAGFDRDFTVVGTREEALRRVFEPVPRRPSRRKSTGSHAAAAPPADAPVDSPPAAVEAAPAAPAAPVPAMQVEPVLPVASPVSASVVPETPDLRDTLATALLEALGVHQPPGAGAARAARADLEAVADGLIAALHAGRA